MKTDTLVIGSAGKRHPEAVTLDIEPRHKPDVVHDLNITPWPFQDNQFEKIICHHVLEHLEGFNSALAELHRICRPEGEIYIEVPHFSSWMANDPAHKLRFNYFSIDAFLADEDPGYLVTDFKFKLLEREVTFHRAFRRYFLDNIFNKFPRAYQRFWTYIVPAEHIKFRIRPLK